MPDPRSLRPGSRSGARRAETVISPRALPFDGLSRGAPLARGGGGDEQVNVFVGQVLPLILREHC